MCWSVNRCACSAVASVKSAAKRKVKCFILCESGFDSLKKVNTYQLFAESEKKERGIPFGTPLFQINSVKNTRLLLLYNETLGRARTVNVERICVHPCREIRHI